MWSDRVDEAKRLLQSDLPTAFPNLQGRYRYLKALLALQRHDAAAAKLLESAIALAKDERDARTECAALNALAQIDDEHQNQLLLRSLAIARQNHLDRLEAITLNNFGMSAHDHGHYAAAISYLLQAITPEKRLNAHSVELLLFGNLGECYQRLGDLAQALQSLQHAQSIVRETDDPDDRANVSLGLAKIASMQLDNTEAEKQFRNAFACVRGHPEMDLYLSATQKLAAALIGNRKLSEAEYYNQLAFQALNAENRSDLHLAWYYLNLGRIEAARGRTVEAAKLFHKVLETYADQPMDVRWSAYAQLAEVEGSQNHSVEAKRDFENAVSMIEAMRSQQGTADRQVTFLSELIRFYDRYIEFLVQQGQSEEALAVADSSRASVLTQGLISDRQNANFMKQLREQAQSSNSQLLFYWLAPKRSYVWLITPSGEDFQVLPGQDELAEQVTAYSRLIQNAKDPLTAPDETGAGLYNTLIRPVAAHLRKGSRVVVVPDGALHGLNFETILVKPSASAAPHYWLEDVSISVAPSLGILLDGSKIQSHSNNALIIGNGDYAGSGWPNLSASKTEVENLSALFPKESTKVLVLRDAVPEAYGQSRPELFSLIHISAHVEANEKSPLDSAIILSPGAYGNRQLYARDFIKTKPLSADLVTISGCNSVGKKPLSGEGMVGFAWAAFQAGARNALTSLWDVDDASTTSLMQCFYNNARKQQMPYYQALREAKLTMLRTTIYKKPYYWAPFQLYSRSLADNRN